MERTKKDKRFYCIPRILHIYLHLAHQIITHVLVIRTNNIPFFVLLFIDACLNGWMVINIMETDLLQLSTIH